MEPRCVVLFTFVGDLRRDSRLHRMAASLLPRMDVHVLALASQEGDTDVGGIHLHERAPGAAASLRRRLPAFWRSGAAEAAAIAPDVCIAADLYSLPIVARLHRRRGVPFIYDSRELYTSIAALQGRRFMQRWWSWLERRHARHASGIMTVNTSIAAVLQQHFPMNPVTVVPNHPDWPPAAPSTALRDALGISPDRHVLLSQGGLQRGRGAFTAVDAVALLDDCELVFLGDGPLHDAIIAHAAALGVQHCVHVHPAVPVTRLPAMTASADLGLCLIENLGSSYHHSLPNKLFEYLAAGLPVVGSAFPEIGAVIDESGAGVTVDPADAAAVATAIAGILRDTRRREELRESALSASMRYSWKAVEPVFVGCVEELKS